MLNTDVLGQKEALIGLLVALFILLVGAVAGGLLTESAWMLYPAICCWTVMTVATTVFATRLFFGREFGRLKSLVIKLSAMTLTTCVCWIAACLLSVLGYAYAFYAAQTASDPSWTEWIVGVPLYLVFWLTVLTLFVFPFMLPFWFFKKVTTSRSRGWLVAIMFLCGILSLTLTDWIFQVF